MAITTFLAVRIVCERGELTGGRVAAFCSHPSENKEMSNKKKGEVSEVFSVNAMMEMEQEQSRQLRNTAHISSRKFANFGRKTETFLNS